MPTHSSNKFVPCTKRRDGRKQGYSSLKGSSLSVKPSRPVGSWRRWSTLLTLLTSDFARHVVDDQTRRGGELYRPGRRPFYRPSPDKDNPQGILAIVRQTTSGSGRSFAGKFSLCGAAAISPQDPGNVGTILRTLDAVGADGLFLLGWGCGAIPPFRGACQHGGFILEAGGAGFFRNLCQMESKERISTGGLIGACRD